MDQLTADVAAQQTVIASAVTLIGGISQRVTDGIAAARAGDFAKLTSLDTDLKTGTQALADAVAANTPTP